MAPEYFGNISVTKHVLKISEGEILLKISINYSTSNILGIYGSFKSFLDPNNIVNVNL